MSTKFISIREAASMTGRPTVKAMAEWVRRFNQKNPAFAIRRIHGAVEESDLQRALMIEMRKFSEGPRP